MENKQIIDGVEVDKTAVDGMKIVGIDTFKTYKNHANSYIIDNYIRNSYSDGSIFAVTKSFSDIEEIMDDKDLWDDYYFFYTDSEGNACTVEI